MTQFLVLAGILAVLYFINKVFNGHSEPSEYHPGMVHPNFYKYCDELFSIHILFYKHLDNAHKAKFIYRVN